jgi:hypothetical protein
VQNITKSVAAMGKQDQDKRGDAMMLGIYVATGLGLGYVIGLWLGNEFGWKTWGPLGGALVGLAGGMYLMIKEGLRINKQ